MSLLPTDFLGVWTIERTVVDAHVSPSARFNGTAEITDMGAHWSFVEQGELTLARGAKMKSERRYLWKPRLHGFDVFFADERFFHHFDLNPQSNASHWCDPDQYDVAYDFSDWPEWSSVWTVSGPRKAYQMRSTFKRDTRG